MPFSLDQIRLLALEHYHLTASVKPLPGEIDLNYFLQVDGGGSFILKIAHPEEQIIQLEFQNAMMRRLAEADPDLEISRIIPASTGEDIVRITAPGGEHRLMRLLTWVEGRPFALVSPHSPELLEKVGALCGKLCRAMDGFDHPAAHRFMKWDPAQTAWTREHLDAIQDESKRSTAEYFLQLFEKEAVPRFDKLRKSVNYNDANDYNVLVSGPPEALYLPGVIDFGDAVYTHTVNEPAIAAAYMAMHKPDPLKALFHLTRGFHGIFPLTEDETAALFPLVGARLLISVTCSAMNLADNPDNEYLQISDAPAWSLLEKLQKIPPALAEAVVRHACGFEPCPKRAAFDAWIRSNAPEFHPLIETDLSRAIRLDLGVGSPDLGGWADIADANLLHKRIEDVLEGRVGIGRYNEIRPFYTTDAYEVRGNEGPEWRTLHIGLDIFIAPGTPVFAPFDGAVHSFQDNNADRDYGPTIILEHRPADGPVFYTLYGHLARTSLRGLSAGQSIKKGVPFCTVGPMPENGNWSPHLHFQVILDMLGCSGDFPGVAFPDQRAVWTSICPDPLSLVRGAASQPEDGTAIDQMLVYRRSHLGKNLSVSYKKPLKILRGVGQYLLDHTGRRYLDTVNNVAHTGHEHPRVVRAAQRQMAVLNTNTRYLHDHILQFAEALIETLPPELEVIFPVNSGSEANELAMRLAKTFTGAQDMIAVEIGYHGNTQACVDVSSYKFDGPGGKGAPAHTHIVPIPDAYRGIYRGNTPDTGAAYARHVKEAVENLRKNGRRPAAFICESVISCGGQVTLPPGFLQAAAAAVREAGGVYIADEVQTGCGRHGAHFWAFQEHGVVPDIVTIGKPIGNGHPLGVVAATRAVADAFANGMEYFNTFGGNPVSCAVGLEVLKVIKEEGLKENAFETGTYLTGLLQELSGRFPIIGDVRGPGLFLGFELVKNTETLAPAPEQAEYLANRMRELGILMSTDGPWHNVLKIKPPMVFDRKNSDFLAEMLERVFKEDFMKV